MDKTRIVSYFLNKRRKEINKYDVNPEDLQTKVLINLTKRAQHTEWGHSHNYNNIKNYNEFANSTPINSYEELKIFLEDDTVMFSKKQISFNEMTNFANTSREDVGRITNIKEIYDSLFLNN